MSNNTIDMSKMTPDAIKSAVLKMVATSPLTVFPVLIALLAVAFWLIFNAVLWIIFAAAGIAVVGIANFAINMTTKKQKWVSKYFAALRAESDAKAKIELIEITNFLDHHEFEQGALQVSRLGESKTSLERVLARKFDPNELAFAQYNGVAQQVYLAALQNLREIVTTIEAIESIDPDYIKGRMGELERVCNENDGLDDIQCEEVDTLKARWQLREDGLIKIDRLLSLNEKAMTELETIASTVANAKTTGDAEADLTSFIDKLNDLGKQAKETWN